MKRTRGRIQIAIIEAMKAGKALHRRDNGTWRLDGKSVSRDACAGLYTYGDIMQGFDGSAEYILTEQGRRP